jgi:hypothetical protein
MTDTTPEKNLPELLTNMDATIYRLSLLCNRFEKDKDMVLKEGLGIKDAVNSLQKEIAAFATMRSALDGILANRLEKASDAIFHKARDSVQEVLRENLKEAAHKLNNALYHTEQKLQYFYGLDKKRIVWMAIGFVILPVVTGIFIAKLLMPHPIIIDFSKRSCAAYIRACNND